MTVKEAIIKLMDFPMDSYIRNSDGESVEIDFVPSEDDWGNPIVRIIVNEEEHTVRLGTAWY